MKFKSTLSRRQFFKRSAAVSASAILPAALLNSKASAESLPPSERVNLALVGIGNQGNGIRGRFVNSGLCNVVAMCDVDLEGDHVVEALEAHPRAATFTDFRKMFDQMADDIDAVIVATPDHSHFSVTMLAMSLGKHVYVEKPLAHTYGQCVRLMDLAERSGVVTQVGNQGFSGANYFQFKAWREAGVIKDVTRVTAHMNRHRRWHGWGANVTEYPSDPMPGEINWDVWHDVIDAERPFSSRLHPQEWRSWYEFGSGAFGDWGPHILDTCHHFLDLGNPETITPVLLEGANPLVYPQASTIRFSFPARGPELPACEVTWFDGQGNEPQLEAEFAEPSENEATGEVERRAVALSQPGKVIYSKDMVFQGGTHANALRVIPREKFMEIRRDLPRFPQRNSDHYTNFLLACKGEEAARAPFKIGGPLNQMFNLGIIAQRLGVELKFDRGTEQITNHSGAQALLDPAPRRGWEEFYAL